MNGPMFDFICFRIPDNLSEEFDFTKDVVFRSVEPEILRETTEFGMLMTLHTALHEEFGPHTNWKVYLMVPMPSEMEIKVEFALEHVFSKECGFDKMM